MPDAPGRTVLTQGTSGSSAYDLAKQHGFQGTEQAWLDSLKGETGHPTFFVNRGDWLMGSTYSPNDYVFDTPSVGGGVSAWLVKSKLAFVSVAHPKDDLSHWLEALAAPGTTFISTHGTTPLVVSQSYLDVAFPIAQPDTSWAILYHNIYNTIDASPLNIKTGIVTSKTVGGFRLQLDGMADTAHYFLKWGISTSVAESEATTYFFTGPSSGTTGLPSTNFTVQLLLGDTVPAPVTITPNDSGGGGTFTPSTVVLTTGSPSATFTYTPISNGVKTLRVTNDGGLINPANLTYTASAASPHLLSSLISYWKLDEAAGSARNDSQGTNHLAESAATVGSFAFVINNGAYAAGAGANYLSHASNASLQVTSDFFFSAWVRVDSPATANTVFIGKNNAAITLFDYILLHSSTNGLTFQAGGQAVSVGAPATAFSVHHIVAWFDSADSKLRLRIDDTTTYVSPGAATLIQGTDPFAILSASYGNLNWNGLVDEVGFWKRKPTSIDITTLYNGGAGTPFSSFTI